MPTSAAAEDLEQRGELGHHLPVFVCGHEVGNDAAAGLRYDRVRGNARLRMTMLESMAPSAPIQNTLPQ